MDKRLLSVLLSISIVIFSSLSSVAQCAMCRSTVVNNVSNGESLSLAEGLNFGIIYLFAAPYLLVGLIAFLWYKNAKKNKVRTALP
ncbi:MAG: hypothetical protein RJQ09_09970 [Cyclobacteriaceae bacterium]